MIPAADLALPHAAPAAAPPDLGRPSHGVLRAHLDAVEDRARSLADDLAEELDALRILADSLSDTLIATADGPPGEARDLARQLARRLDAATGRATLAAAPLEESSRALRGAADALLAHLTGLELEARNLVALNVVASLLARETDVDRLLESVMDTVITMANGERGFLILADDAGRLEFRVARHLDRAEVDAPEFAVSRSIIESTIASRVSLCLSDAGEDARFAAAASVRRLALRSVVCVPLATEDRVLGVLYLENSRAAGIFTDKDVALLDALGREVATGIERALLFRRLERRGEELAQQLRARYDFGTILGNAPSLVRVLQLTADVADTDATVLIQGDSGTGKELLARAIHANSRRRHQPFVALNCAAIPEHLLESELFGHVRGAFTGALESKPGKFEVAEGGTLFMDEIGDMSPALQMKLLRVLQEREVERLGSNRPVHVDVRILAATNRDLRTLTHAGGFREDLFHRLNVINIVLPPLRERPEDVLPLAQAFLARQAKTLGRRLTGFSAGAARSLTGYDYPGNVRELENLVNRAAILARDTVVTEEELPDYVRAAGERAAPPAAAPPAALPDGEIGRAAEHTLAAGASDASPTLPLTSRALFEAKRRAREAAYAAVERPFLEDALRRSDGRVSRAAADVGMNRVQFHGLLRKHGLEARAYRPVRVRRGDGPRAARAERAPAEPVLEAPPPL